MDDKIKVDILKAISQIHRSQFDERRRYEWKVLLLPLGIYATILASKYTNTVQLPSTTLFQVCFWVMSLLLAVISSLYLWFTHHANEVNHKFAHAAEDALMKISGVEQFDEVRESLPQFVWNHWSYACQVGTIFLFGVATAGIVLYT